MKFNWFLIKTYLSRYNLLLVPAICFSMLTFVLTLLFIDSRPSSKNEVCKGQTWVTSDTLFNNKVRTDTVEVLDVNGSNCKILFNGEVMTMEKYFVNCCGASLLKK